MKETSKRDDPAVLVHGHLAFFLVRIPPGHLGDAMVDEGETDVGANNPHYRLTTTLLPLFVGAARFIFGLGNEDSLLARVTGMLGGVSLGGWLDLFVLRRAAGARC
jgi:hypothetical protein